MNSLIPAGSCQESCPARDVPAWACWTPFSSPAKNRSYKRRGGARATKQQSSGSICCAVNSWASPTYIVARSTTASMSSSHWSAVWPCLAIAKMVRQRQSLPVRLPVADCGSLANKKTASATSSRASEGLITEHAARRNSAFRHPCHPCLWRRYEQRHDSTHGPPLWPCTVQAQERSPKTSGCVCEQQGAIMCG